MPLAEPREYEKAMLRAIGAEIHAFVGEYNTVAHEALEEAICDFARDLRRHENSVFGNGFNSDIYYIDDEMMGDAKSVARAAVYACNNTIELYIDEFPSIPDHFRLQFLSGYVPDAATFEPGVAYDDISDDRRARKHVEIVWNVIEGQLDHVIKNEIAMRLAEAHPEKWAASEEQPPMPADLLSEYPHFIGLELVRLKIREHFMSQTLNLGRLNEDARAQFLQETRNKTLESLTKIDPPERRFGLRRVIAAAQAGL